MFVWTARISRKRTVLLLLAALAAAALIVFLFFQMRDSPPGGEPQLVSNEDRIVYLQSLGWEVQAEPLETLQFLIPKKLGEPYLAYNELQKAQGYDLSECCGKQVTRYTYALTNYPGRPDGVQLNLYICEGAVAAGDVIAAGQDGFQVGLAYPKE